MAHPGAAWVSSAQSITEIIMEEVSWEPAMAKWPGKTMLGAAEGPVAPE